MKDTRHSKLIYRLKKQLSSVNNQVATCKDQEYVLKLEKRRDNLKDRLDKLIASLL